MANALPHSAAAAAVAAANAAASASISSSPIVPGPARAEQANNLRLMAIYDRLSLSFNGLTRFETFDVILLCYSLAKGIDCSLTLNDIPGIASRLPPLVKKVYEWRNNAALQSAIMMVLISIKNACRRRWFQPAESEELLCMVYEFWSKFCTEVCLNTLVSHTFDTISKIMPKFYPHMRLCSLIASFEAKPGYDVLMSDFHFPKTNPPEQKIVLIVVKTESLDTSSCIASPPQVSFLVNGKGVEKRNNLSLDHGPQFPTDISTMLKYGINMLQMIGYFDGTYLIAIAYMSRSTTFTPPALKEYVQPVVAALAIDSEIIEGPSRISLSCPISFKRIKTPVKGHFCKHHQCFDYDNFLEMNSRKPNWRCPHCNQPVCMIDLRIDKNMVKILEEMGEDVSEVAIQTDGSWNVVAEHERYTDQLPNGTQGHFQAENMECEPNRSKNSMADPVDLTMEEDENSDLTETQRQEVSLDGYASQSCNNNLETEDRKPFIDIGGIRVSQVLANPPLANHTSNAAQVPPYQLGSSMQPTVMLSYDANGSVASARPPHVGSSQTLRPNLLGNLVIPDALLDQSQIVVHALPAMCNLTERIAGRPISRYVDRTPIAVQALPVPQQSHSASRRLQANLLDTALLAPNNLSPGQYQAGNASTTTLENFSGGIGNMDMQQIIGTADTSAMQDHVQPNHQYILNSSSPQQVVGLTSPNMTNNRSPFSQRRWPSDLNGFRASMQPSSYTLNSLQAPPGFRTHHSMGQASNVLPQSPRLPSAVRLASQNPIGLASGNFGNQRNKTQPPLPARPMLSPTANSQPSRDSSRVLGTDRWRSLTGGMPSPLSRSDALPELPAEQNWIPGLMRGSLIGEDYSAVLNRYMPPLSQSATARPTPSSSAPSATDQVSALIANNLMVHGAVNPQANSSQDNLGAQQGDTGI